jgi:hypothetical protein
VSKFNIRNTGVGSSGKLIPHPGYTVKIAVRLGKKVKAKYKAGIAKWFPSSKGLYKVTYISSLKSMPKNTHAFFDLIPDNAYNAADIQRMKVFLDSGARAVFTGEHNGYSPAQNQHITDLVKALGGGVMILNNKQNTHVFTNKNMNKLPLTSGLTLFDTGTWASLAVKADVCDVVLAAKDAKHNGKIFMADQILRKGRLTVW